MNEKLDAWRPAIFCALVSAITIIGNVVGHSITGNTNAASVVFFGSLPMCFYFVGMSLSRIHQEHRELRSRIDELTSAQSDDKNAA